MRTFSKFPSGTPKRLEEVIDLQWGIIRRNIHLIASACYPFPSVLHALAQPSFVLPAEGMPGARYLPGADIMDIVELEGEELVLRLFGASNNYGATLQPHSGTQANQIVYNSVLGVDDNVLCLKARDGGHISHTVLIGRRNVTKNYGLTSEGAIDYDQLSSLAKSTNPRLIIVGGSALPREIDFGICGEIARACGAYLHADISHTATFIAAGLHKSVFPHCDFATFNTVKNLRGPNGGVLIFKNDFRSAVHSSIFPTTQGGAHEGTMLAKFAAFLEWQVRDLRKYAETIVNHAKTMASVFSEAGIAITTGGTDCHIVLLELRERRHSGADMERILRRQGILANKNLIPSDPRPPAITSGIRIGTTNLAILGYSESDTALLANWLATVINEGDSDREVPAYLLNKYQRKFDINLT